MMALFGLFTLSPLEIIIILVVGVLLFGRRLPEVGRSLGKGIVEFKKGLRGLEDEVDTATSVREPSNMDVPRPPQRIATNVPKFEDNPVSPPATPKFEESPGAIPTPPKDIS